MLVPWPPMNFVAEWTMMSAPHSIGRQKVQRREGVIDDQRKVMLVGNGGEFLDVEHVAAGVANRLAVERLGVLAHGPFPCVHIVWINPREADVHLLQKMLELVDGAAVERRRRHDVVARLEQREQRGHLRGDAARKRHRAAAAFEVRHALFEDGRGGIHDARVMLPYSCRLKYAAADSGSSNT